MFEPKKEIYKLIQIFAIFLAVAQLLALIGTAQLIISRERQFIIRPLATWYPWAIVAFLVFLLARQWFKQERSIKTIILFLIGVSPIIVCLCVVIQSVLMWIPNREEHSLFSLSVERLITRVNVAIAIYVSLLLGMWTYLRLCRLRMQNRQASLLADHLAKTEIDGMKNNIRLERVLNSLNKIHNELAFDGPSAEKLTARLARSLRRSIQEYTHISQDFESRLSGIQQVTSTTIAFSKTTFTRKILLAIGIFTLVVLFFSFRDALTAKLQNRPFEFTLGIKQNLYWYVWAFLTSPILLMERIFPFRNQIWRRNLIIHIFAGVLVGLASAALLTAINYIVGMHQNESFLDHLKTFPLVIDFTIYWAIIAIATKVRISTKEQQQRTEMAALEAGLSLARLNLLRNQLHPHFLFNCLNTLCELIHENIEQARQMLTNIERFLRCSLELRQAHEVSLSTELQLLNYYLEIQQLRFQEKLVVKTDVRPDLMNLLVPSLILQPLVENSIQHGSAGQSPLRINIQVKAMNGLTHIEISDNGTGLRKDFIEGVGLSNTRRRLVSLYGKHHSFVIQDSPCGGVAILLEFPRRIET